MKVTLILLTCICLITCEHANKSLSNEVTVPSIIPDTTVYTNSSNLLNEYVNFNSPNAVNRIAEIENEYFRNYKHGLSRYYGTEWRKNCELSTYDAVKSRFKDYESELGYHPDSMHCTIYAVEAIKAGLDSLWTNLEKSHKKIYNEHEHAGWSIARILVKEFGWNAYWIVDSYAEEYKHCNASFKRDKSYPVWNQPNIPLTSMFVRDEQDSLITELLEQNEFGWGFSQQGYHTWITRFSDLKECIWYGAPAEKYEITSLPLFRTTPFLDYFDYHSHVVVFPPKLDDFH